MGGAKICLASRDTRGTYVHDRLDARHTLSVEYSHLQLVANCMLRRDRQTHTQ